MDGALFIVVAVLSLALFRTARRLNEIEESSAFDSLLIRVIVKILDEKEFLTKDDLINTERSMKRLREDLDSDWFEDKIEYFD